MDGATRPCDGRRLTTSRALVQCNTGLLRVILGIAIEHADTISAMPDHHDPCVYYARLCRCLDAAQQIVNFQAEGDEYDPE